MIMAVSRAFMRYTLLILFFVLQIHVGHTQSIYDTYAQQAAPELDSTAEFFNVVTHQFVLINNARYKQKNYTELVAAGATVPGLINAWKYIIMNIKDTLDFNLLTIVKSEDKNLCIVSWDTRLGDTKIDYASIILYKIKDSVYLQQQKQEFIRNVPENPKIRYTSIYTINAKDKKIFLAKGYGQGRTTEPWQEIKTFCLSDSILTQPNILPGKKNRIFIAVNNIEQKGIRKTPPLLYDSTKLTLTVPVTDKQNMFTGSYTSYRFNEKKFKEIKDWDVRYALVPY